MYICMYMYIYSAELKRVRRTPRRTVYAACTLNGTAPQPKAVTFAAAHCAAHQPAARADPKAYE